MPSVLAGIGTIQYGQGESAPYIQSPLDQNFLRKGPKFLSKQKIFGENCGAKYDAIGEVSEQHAWMDNHK